MSSANRYAYVPRIDISPLYGGDMDAKISVAKQIDKACRGVGFFLAANHGIDVKAALDEAARFHKRITDEEKMTLAIRAYNKKNVKQIRNGYSLPREDTKLQQNFCFLNPEFTEDHPAIRDNLPGHEVNVWPSETRHAGFRKFQEEYYRSVFDMSMAMLRAISLALGKEENYFEKYITSKGTLSSVVLIRYPFLENYPPVQVAKDGTKLGFGAHRDVSLLTVLLQSDVQNLQVETPDGYLDIPSSADCFIVNAGSYMDYLTSGYYTTPVHRVKFVNAERLSLPFFLNMDYQSKPQPFVPHDQKGELAKAPWQYGTYLEDELLALIESNGQT